MGGNALIHCTRRYYASEYFELADRIKSFIKDTLGVRCDVIEAYSEKESFGDIDVIVESNDLHPEWKQKIIDALDLEEWQYVSNGNCFTIKFEDIQADLIVTSRDNYDSSLFYFAYNDLGNLLGRLYHRNGVKLGFNGLYLIVRPRVNQLEHVIGDVFLTRDKDTILEMIGLDPEQYGKFSKIEDIFKFVASSKYFNPNIYLFENRNSESRVRDRKRKTYNAFLQWCEENSSTLQSYPYETFDGRFGYHINDRFLDEVVLKYFPNAKVEVEEMIDEYELDLEFKKVFNGKHVSEWTGLEGKELGYLMKEAKEKLAESPKDLYVAHPQLVKTVVMELFNQRNQNATN